MKQGIADPAKLGIVGWSYGGYAALQSVAIDPTVFKAIVAIAPVTDLAALKRRARLLVATTIQVSDFVGAGPQYARWIADQRTSTNSSSRSCSSTAPTDRNVVG